MNAGILAGLSSGGVGIRSIQNGFVNAGPTSGSAGSEDATYIDTAITPVDQSKSIVFVQSGVSGGTTDLNLTARLTSASNVRLSCMRSSGYGFLAGRFTVVEFA